MSPSSNCLLLPHLPQVFGLGTKHLTQVFLSWGGWKKELFFPAEGKFLKAIDLVCKAFSPTVFIAAGWDFQSHAKGVCSYISSVKMNGIHPSGVSFQVSAADPLLPSSSWKKSRRPLCHRVGDFSSTTQGKDGLEQPEMPRCKDQGQWNPRRKRLKHTAEMRWIILKLLTIADLLRRGKKATNQTKQLLFYKRFF